MDEFTFPERVNVLTSFIIFGLVGGFFLGLFQWFIMRTKISRAGRWILATTIGWSISFSMLLFIEVFYINYYTPSVHRVVVNALSLVIFGLAQWLILRSEVQKAGWWVMAYAIGFAVSSGIAITIVESYEFLDVSVFIIPFLGIATGFALLYLFKESTVEAI